MANTRIVPLREARLHTPGKGDPAPEARSFPAFCRGPPALAASYPMVPAGIWHCSHVGFGDNSRHGAGGPSRENFRGSLLSMAQGD